MRAPAVLVAVAIAGPAAAEPLEPPPQVTTWQLDASAGLGSSPNRAARAEVAVDGDVGHEGGIAYGFLFPRIDTRLGAALASGGDNDGLAVRHSTRAVVIGPVPGGHDAILPFEADYQLERHVRPELSRPLGLLRRTYSRAAAGGTLAFAEIHGWRILTMGMHVSAVRQELSDGTARHTQYDPELAFFTWTRRRDDGAPELALDIIRGGGPAVAVADGPDASVGRIDFVALRNLPVAGGAYIDGSIGVAGTGSFSASVTDGDGNVDWETTVMTEDLPLLSLPVAAARLHGALGDRVRVAVGAARTVELTGEVDLALDDRATAALSWTGARSAIALEGFAARTRLWTDADTSTTSRTGGGLIAYRREVGHELSVTATVEVARSFYAVLDGDPVPRPELAARGGLELTRSFGGSSTR